MNEMFFLKMVFLVPIKMILINLQVKLYYICQAKGRGKMKKLHFFYTFFRKPLYILLYKCFTLSFIS